jgi:outer membrane immunogenic protein
MRYVNSKLLLAAVTSLGLTTMASAADLPARTYTKAPEYAPSCAWCGWYIGANGGGAWSTGTGSLVDFAPNFANTVGAGLTPATLGSRHQGGFGGGQFGYNQAMGTLLLGFEADIQGAGIGSTNTVNVAAPAGSSFPDSISTGRDRIDWFGTARGRLGVTVGSVLFYGTGGLAFGGVESSASNTFVNGGGSFTGSSSDTRFGWAAGLGFEWKFAPSWSLKTEYLHVDLGSSTVTIADPTRPGTADYRFNHAFETARVGVNYHFGAPVVAKY